MNRRYLCTGFATAIVAGLGGCFDPQSKRASNIKDVIVEQYINEPWVEAIGIGTRGGEQVVVVTVSDKEKVPDDFPEEKGRVRIVIEEGEIVPLG